VSVADPTRCTTLGIAHFPKASGTDPLLLIAGAATVALRRVRVAAARQQKRESFMRHCVGLPADEAKAAALWYYGPPSRDR